MTPFGKQMRKYRIDHDMTMSALASKLRTHQPYISMMENGKSSVSPKLVLQLASIFGLSEEETANLKALSKEHNKHAYGTAVASTVKIKLAGLSEQAADFATLVAENIHKLSDTKLQQLVNTIKEGEHADN